MKKRALAFLALASVLPASTVGFTSCSKVKDDENTLQIFISKFGYGTEWLDDVIEEFKNQAWVKEKYPNLEIPKPKSNSDRDFPGNSMITDGKTNPYDLLFSCSSANAYYDRTDASGKGFFEDLTDVYNAKIPGEGETTVADKMKDEILLNYQHTKRTTQKPITLCLG